RSIERCRHHAHARNLVQAFVDSPIQRLHLLNLIVAQVGVDRSKVTVLSFKSEILVLQVSQTLAQKSGRGEQHQGYRSLRDYQRLLRPRAATTNRTLCP